MFESLKELLNYSALIHHSENQGVQQTFPPSQAPPTRFLVGQAVDPVVGLHEFGAVHLDGRQQTWPEGQEPLVCLLVGQKNGVFSLQDFPPPVHGPAEDFLEDFWEALEDFFEETFDEALEEPFDDALEEILDDTFDERCEEIAEERGDDCTEERADERVEERADEPPEDLADD